MIETFFSPSLTNLSKKRKVEIAASSTKLKWKFWFCRFFFFFFFVGAVVFVLSSVERKQKMVGTRNSWKTDCHHKTIFSVRSTSHVSLLNYLRRR